MENCEIDVVCDPFDGDVAWRNVKMEEANESLRSKLLIALGSRAST